ncbi:prepilin-type cleavage/methylation domain-containing protein [Pseudoxanthomonas jiangsuensis]|uniref:type II secretion system protein n=1 Tax=Pseudoxanthomonas jiangsuensis TaxID=619688 RepID=UPI0013913E87|nr:type II secretion system protein [Pseudoxanthomonas jiangsuensis]KAF1698366.1 prepilin-type cleavage/methylation domain-containing protein [Pseudoxanthomonas jiangsuensis]
MNRTTRFRPPGRPLNHPGAGFTLLELMFAIAVVAVMAILAAGQFSQYVDRARSAAAAADIAEMEVLILRYRNAHDGVLPDSLADVGKGALLDPWRRPYHYTNLEAVKGKGAARKDKRLNPLNSDYDLFSAGKDGVFKPQVSQKDSLDDVIRARDGAYIGPAADF